MTELKPCPFCGGEVSLKDMGYFLMISRANRSSCKCGVFLESRAFTRDNLGAMERAKERLIGKWNTRANPWHTGKIIEDGDYMVAFKQEDGSIEYGWCHWDGIGLDILNDVDGEIVAWQKIERFEEESNG